MGSISKKFGSLGKHGVKAINEGVKNFKFPIPEMEELAKKRIKLSEPYLVREPISFLRVEDERIPAASNMMFEDCGCTASYFIRQSIILRPEWNEDN